MWKKTAAACVIAGTVVLGAPMAASAETADDTVGYVEPTGVTVNPVGIEPCLTSTVTFGARYWAPSEAVAIEVEGYHAADASIPASATASADGSLVTTFVPPADGREDYGITFTAASRSYTAVIAVTDGVDASASCDHDPGADPAALASTGSDTAPWIAVAGAGMLVAGVAVIATRTAARRRA
jgi:LPXTG-motif cell wall-anchored protein